MLSLLKNFREIIKEFEIDLFEREGNRQRLKATITFVDGSRLYVKDYYFGLDRKYAYNWINQRGELIIRWDNASHWREIATFPHHKHIGLSGKVEPSLEIGLAEVLTVIKKEIARH